MAAVGFHTRKLVLVRRVTTVPFEERSVIKINAGLVDPVLEVAQEATGYLI